LRFRRALRRGSDRGKQVGGREGREKKKTNYKKVRVEKVEGMGRRERGSYPCAE
jgi:hypothetical protein